MAFMLLYSQKFKYGSILFVQDGYQRDLSFHPVQCLFSACCLQAVSHSSPAMCLCSFDLGSVIR